MKKKMLLCLALVGLGFGASSYLRKGEGKKKENNDNKPVLIINHRGHRIYRFEDKKAGYYIWYGDGIAVAPIRKDIKNETNARKKSRK